jgi:hypothetical protein
MVHLLFVKYVHVYIRIRVRTANHKQAPVGALSRLLTRKSTYVRSRGHTCIHVYSLMLCTDTSTCGPTSMSDAEPGWSAWKLHWSSSSQGMARTISVNLVLTASVHAPLALSSFLAANVMLFMICTLSRFSGLEIT